MKDHILYLQDRLTARDLEPYVQVLDSLFGPEQQLGAMVNTMEDRFQDFVHSMDNEVTAKQLHEEILQRVNLLKQAVVETLQLTSLATQEDWSTLVSAIKQQVAEDVLEGYFIKTDVLVGLLQAVPPTGVLKYLGHTSIDECLKHESIFEVFSALRFSEPEEWMMAFIEKYQTLTSSDFEQREVQFILLEPDKWWKLAKDFAKKKKHHFSHLKEVGVVFSYPDPDQIGDANAMLGFIMMMLHYVYEVNFYSRFFETASESGKQFGEMFVQVLQGDQGLSYDNETQLPIVQQYHRKKSDIPIFVFQPHVMPEALHWQNARKLLFTLIASHPNFSAFKFWETGVDVVGFIDGVAVSLNFEDNLLSHSDEHLVYHAYETIWNSILAAYIGESRVEDNIIHYFSNQSIDLTHLI